MILHPELSHDDWFVDVVEAGYNPEPALKSKDDMQELMQEMQCESIINAKYVRSGTKGFAALARPCATNQDATPSSPGRTYTLLHVRWSRRGQESARSLHET